MYLPRKLYLFWRRKIFLRSISWKRTRAYELKRQGAYCHYKTGRRMCMTRERIELHHIDHDGQPKPNWLHFLPFARFFMWRRDTSRLVPLCHYHHMQVTLIEKTNRALNT